MLIRRLLTILGLVLLVVAPPALAESSASGGLSPVRVLPYAALMKLPKQKQIEYVRGLRQILVDLQQIQKSAHHTSEARRRTHAQIVFLEAFIEKAEAWDLRNTACNPILMTKPHIKAHVESGANFMCFTNTSISTGCPANFKKLGLLGKQIVCLDVSHENHAKFARLAAEIDHPALKDGKPVAYRSPVVKKKAVSAKNAESAERVAIRKTPPKASVAKSDKPVKQGKASEKPNKADNGDADDQSADGQANADDAGVTKDVDQAKHEVTAQNHAPNQTENLDDDGNGYNRHSSAYDKADAKKFDQGGKASQFEHQAGAFDQMRVGSFQTEDAESATSDRFAADVVAVEKDQSGDIHMARRQIADFNAHTGDVRLDKIEAKSDSCKEPPPEKAVNCSKDDKDAAGAQLAKDKRAPHCMAPGGLFSHFDSDSSDLQCRSTNEFCLNSLICRKGNGDFVHGAQVLLHCAKDQTICNPYVFNVDNDGKPFCVSNSDKSLDVMTKCAALSDADPKRGAFVLNTSAPNGTIEGWNEFGDEFARMCFDKSKGEDGQSRTPQSTYYCEECAFLKNRIWKLNAAALVKKDDEDKDLCYRMQILQSDSNGNITRRGSGQTVKAKQ